MLKDQQITMNKVNALLQIQISYWIWPCQNIRKQLLKPGHIEFCVQETEKLLFKTHLHSSVFCKYEPKL